MATQEIVLMSSDGQAVRIARGAATHGSVLLRDMLDDVPAAATTAVELAVPVVTGAILQHCADFMAYRFSNPKAARELERPLTAKVSTLLDEKDKERLLSWDEATVIAIVKAASFLNATDLLDLASAQVASLMMDKSIEEIRVMLGMENDFTPEEEAQLRAEYGLELMS
jgi:S-phase kinase-associated protein 1